MIRSMTGYGIRRKKFDGYEVQVEIKGVNHRYFETNIRTPYAYSFINDKLKTIMQKRIHRGKIDMTVYIESDGTLPKKVNVDLQLAKAYYNAMKEVSDSLSLSGEISLESIIRQKDVLRPVDEGEENSETIWQIVSETAEEAIDDFIKMRENEGQNLKKDMLVSLDNMTTMVLKVDELYDEALSQYELKLYTKLKELIETKDMEDDRILTEVAIFADRTSINEEIVRLKSHIKQMTELLNGASPIGKKMDFLAQEMNREVNTVGSKSQFSEISKLVVSLKSEVEKIREQVQNIE